MIDDRATRVEQGLSRVALFGARFTIDIGHFDALDGVKTVSPRATEVDEIHRIYFDLAQNGLCTPNDDARLRDIALRQSADAIVLRQSYWLAPT